MGRGHDSEVAGFCLNTPFLPVQRESLSLPSARAGAILRKWHQWKEEGPSEELCFCLLSMVLGKGEHGTEPISLPVWTRAKMVSHRNSACCSLRITQVTGESFRLGFNENSLRGSLSSRKLVFVLWAGHTGGGRQTQSCVALGETTKKNWPHLL